MCRNSADALPISGRQITISRGDFTATIASVGASLREFTAAGVPLVVPFNADELRPSHRGATIAPWANRIVDGAYEFAGKNYQLALSEPARGHAIHGFTSWMNFDVITHTTSRAVLAATIEPQRGYPWRVRVEVTFELTDTGLTWEVAASNLLRPGSPNSVAPYGVCAHPYFIAGATPVSTWNLKLSAREVLTVSEPRLIPGTCESVAVHAARFDFRAGKTLRSLDSGTVETAPDLAPDFGFDSDSDSVPGSDSVPSSDPATAPTSASGSDSAPAPGSGSGSGSGSDSDSDAEASDVIALDHAFTDFERDSDGKCAIELTSPEGSGVRVSFGPEISWVQVYTSDEAGVAIEPMTCAPDSYNRGRASGLVELKAGQTHRAAWDISPIHPPKRTT